MSKNAFDRQKALFSGDIQYYLLLVTSHQSYRNRFNDFFKSESVNKVKIFF